MKQSTASALDAYLAVSSIPMVVADGIGFTVNDVAAKRGISSAAAGRHILADCRAGIIKKIGRRGRMDVYDTVK